jgi:hypothetical protein
MVPPDDIVSFMARFPELLQVADNCNCWRGPFTLHASFGGVAIEDAFEIEIETPPRYPNAIPVLREVGGRTEEIARKHRVRSILDLHKNPGPGTACVCVKQEETIRFPPGSTLNTFVDNLVVPYLYGLAFFDRNGRWPWGEYSHGTLGILEFVGDHGIEPSVEAIRSLAGDIQQDSEAKVLLQQLHRLSQNRHCPCGSRRPFRRCHANAWRGLLQMRRAMKKLGLSVKDVFPDAST